MAAMIGGMATVALVAHPERPRAHELAREAVAWLQRHGHEARVPESDAAAMGMPELSIPATTLGDVDLALSLGGDGTMLRAVALVGPGGAPILGVNVGHLGYLTEVDPDGMGTALERFFAGDYTVEERTTLSVGWEGRTAGEKTAFNEAVLEKTVTGHTVRVAVTIDEKFFTTYQADGVIVATPTGSTAYNLSARGPIVSPRLAALLMTPVSPHMLFDRTLVLHPSETVRLEVLEARPAALVVDGHPVGTLEPGDAVACRVGDLPARLVMFGERDFHRILKAKFGLADR